MKHLISPAGKRTGQAVLLSALLAATAGAQAAQTASGTDISNQATLDFSVGGVSQTAIPSNTATFKVDKKVAVNVATADTSYVSVAPNANLTPGTYAATLKVLTFNVTNTGNDPQKIYLATSESGVTDPFGGADNFNSSGCATYVDTNGNNAFDSADAVVTSIASLASDATAKVFVACSIPSTQLNGDIAAVALTASVGAVGGSAAYVAADQDLNADNPAAVQVVFADGQGAYDGNRDAKYSGASAYKVATTTLTVTKNATTICDPANGNNNPKAIPGAYVQYAITIANTGTLPAVLTTLTDALQATNTAIDPDLKTAATSCATAASAAGSGFSMSCVGGSRACATTPKYFTTTTSADGIDHDGSLTGGTVTANFSTALAAEGSYQAGELKPGESVTVRFNVIIQ